PANAGAFHAARDHYLRHHHVVFRVHGHGAADHRTDLGTRESRNAMKAAAVCFALACFTLDRDLGAQETLLRAVPDKSEVWLDARCHLPDQVVVKFAEGTDIRASKGTLVAPRDLAPVLAVLGQRAVR